MYVRVHVKYERTYACNTHAWKVLFVFSSVSASIQSLIIFVPEEIYSSVKPLQGFGVNLKWKNRWKVKEKGEKWRNFHMKMTEIHYISYDFSVFRIPSVMFSGNFHQKWWKNPQTITSNAPTRAFVSLFSSFFVTSQSRKSERYTPEDTPYGGIRWGVYLEQR